MNVTVIEVQYQKTTYTATESCRGEGGAGGFIPQILYCSKRQAIQQHIWRDAEAIIQLVWMIH